MAKISAYLTESEMAKLRQLARSQKRPIADLVRETICERWFGASDKGPVALSNGEIRDTGLEHDQAFDEI